LEVWTTAMQQNHDRVLLSDGFEWDGASGCSVKQAAVASDGVNRSLLS
jgi:hypothetical protein